MENEPTGNRKYKIKECMIFLREKYDRYFTRLFRERIYTLMGISHAKFYRYQCAKIGAMEKADCCSVSQMKMFVEQFNRMVDEHEKISLEEMYHPAIVEEELKLYKQPVVQYFPTTA